MFGMNHFLAGLAAAPGVRVANHHFGRTHYPKGHGPRGRGFHPRINRWTGKPHEHAREIARHQRQAARG